MSSKPLLKGSTAPDFSFYLAVDTTTRARKKKKFDMRAEPPSHFISKWPFNFVKAQIQSQSEAFRWVALTFFSIHLPELGWSETTAPNLGLQEDSLEWTVHSCFRVFRPNTLHNKLIGKKCHSSWESLSFPSMFAINPCAFLSLLIVILSVAALVIALPRTVHWYNQGIPSRTWK